MIKRADRFGNIMGVGEHLVHAKYQGLKTHKKIISLEGENSVM